MFFKNPIFQNIISLCNENEYYTTNEKNKTKPLCPHMKEQWYFPNNYKLLNLTFLKQYNLRVQAFSLIRQ